MNKELDENHKDSTNFLKELANEDYIFKNSVRLLRKCYQDIAWNSWINKKDIKSFKNGLHNSILTLIRSNENFNNLGSYMNLPRILLCELALSDNQDLMRTFSLQDYEVNLPRNKTELYSELIKSPNRQIYPALFIASMRRNMTALRDLLQIIDSSKSKKLYFENELPIFRGLLDGDKDLIFTTINEISSPRNHKRTNSYNGPIKEFISFPAIGYAKIAWISNYQIEFSNKYIDNELLPIVPNLSYQNVIDSVINKMTLESEYLFYEGSKKKIRNNLYDVFVFSPRDSSGRNKNSEELIPNIFENEANFIGLKTGQKYKSGQLIGTSRTVDSSSLLKKATQIKKIASSEKNKALLILQKYLDEIDEISKTQRGVKIELNSDYSFKYSPIIKHNNIKAPKNLPRIKKEALVELGKYCLDEDGYEAYIKIIKSIKNYDKHEDYGSTLNYLSIKLQEESILQFFSLDWKSEILGLESLVEQSIKHHFDLKVEIDVSSKFPQYSSISTGGCISTFKSVLINQSIGLKVLDSGGDNYIFLLYKSKNNDLITELLSKIEFKIVNNY